MTFLAWLRGLLFRNPPKRRGFTAFESPEGARIIVDDSYMRYLESQAAQPTQESLQKVLARVTRVKVSLGGVAEGRPLSERILVDTDMQAEIQGLREALRIEDGSAGHCMCYGDTGILLFDSAGRQLGVIGVHHGQTIRWDQWKDDAQLVDGWQLIDWLIDRGIPYPLSAQQIRERSLAQIARFLGSSLERVGRAIYATPDGGTSVSLGVCGSDPEASFLCAFRSDQQAVLQKAVRAYAAFACGSPYRVLLIPFPQLASWLSTLPSVAVSGGDSYWPIRLSERGERLLLQGLHVQQEVDLRSFLLPKHR